METPPQLGPGDLDKYRQKRASFVPAGSNCISFFCCPAVGNPNSTNTQSVPAPSANRLADVSDDEFRVTVALSFLRVGIGQESQRANPGDYWTGKRAPPGNWDQPPGRQGAYLDLVAPFENNRTGWIGDDADNHGKSSCGLFIRGMWQLLGGGQPAPGANEQEFRTEYKSGVIEAIIRLAAGYGASAPPPFGSPHDPQDGLALGDVLVVTPLSGNGQHIFTVAFLDEVQGRPLPFGCKDQLVIYSVDGGNGFFLEDGGSWRPPAGKQDGPCIGIKNFERTLHWENVVDHGNGDLRGQWTLDNKYSVYRHISLAKMKASFNEPWMLPYTP